MKHFSGAEASIFCDSGAKSVNLNHAPKEIISKNAVLMIFIGIEDHKNLMNREN
jgi:hypothetical protein